MRIATTLLLALPLGVAAASGSGLSAPLQPLEFLVGHCWSGTFPDGKSTDTHCFESMYGGRFVRDRHVVRGNKPDYSGETIYWIDGASGRVSYMYFNSDGGVSNGTLTSADASRLQFADEEFTGRDGKQQKYRSVWNRKGDDGYVTVTEQEADGKWVEAWRVEFKRQPRPSAP